MLEEASVSIAIPTANPRAKAWDPLPPAFRIWWKQSIISSLLANHHDEIIPTTDNHGAWVLGAQPGDSSIRLLKDEHPKATNLQIINMLTDREKVTPSDPTTKGWNSSSPVAKKKWSDHGCLNQDTGQIETVATMLDFQDEPRKEFNKPETVCYCHCMAGVARSLTETAIFLYTYIYFPAAGDTRTLDERIAALFDFDQANWTPIWDKIAKKIDPEKAADLKARLQSRPTFFDLIEYVRLQRPTAKNLTTVEGDQAGLMGSVALSNFAAKNIGGLTHEQLRQHALDIGLILRAPLDQAFRDPKDRELQREKFRKVFFEYHENMKRNLLLDMLPKASNETDDMLDSERFAKRFENLTPSAQARLAILMQEVNAIADEYSYELYPVNYAIKASEQVKKLTTGDQVELLRVFLDDSQIFYNLGYSAVAQKIMSGNSIDRYNAGIQLAALYNVARKKGDDGKFIANALLTNKMPYAEQYNFLIRLATNPDVEPAEITKYATIVAENYSKRWFKFFNNPLSPAQGEYIGQLITAPKLVESTETINNSKGVLTAEAAASGTVELEGQNAEQLKSDLE